MLKFKFSGIEFKVALFKSFQNYVSKINNNEIATILSISKEENK